MFHEVYIRLAASETFERTLGLGSGPLDDAYRLKMVDADAAIEMEPNLRDIGDGTAYVASEGISFKAATLKVSPSELELLKAFDGEICDILFLDPYSLNLNIAVYRLRIHVVPIAQSADVALIALTGNEAVNLRATKRGVFIEDFTSINDFGIVRGRVVDESGDPLKGVLITDQGGYYPVKSGPDGEFNLVFIAGSQKELYASLTGYTFGRITLDVPEYDVIDIGDWEGVI